MTSKEEKTESPEEGRLNCQLDFLKMELESINAITGRIDGMTQTIKNWCVGIWAGSIAISITEKHPELVYFTVLFPLLFWFVDGWWRRIQRSFIYRSLKISEFLNSEDLLESFRRNRLVNFKVLDPKGKQYESDPNYQSFRSVFRTMNFHDVGVFYFGLCAISIVAGFLVSSGT